MNFDMSRQLSCLCKSSVTMFTNIWFFASMNSHVKEEAALLSILFGTHLARGSPLDILYVGKARHLFVIRY